MGSLFLELNGERCIVHTNLCESGEYFFGIAAINRQHVIHCPVIGKGEQGLFRDCIDSFWGRECFDVKDI